MAHHFSQLGTARSLDGRTFTADVPARTLRAGLVMALESDTGPARVGLALSVSEHGERDQVFGVVVGNLTADGGLSRGRRTPFSDAAARPLREEEVRGLQASTGATLPVGQWDLPGAEADLCLRPGGFGRHTFLCGQSGSGKTYALGVILEQLILRTRLPITVLDPNGDFVYLGTPRPEAAPAVAEALRHAGVDVSGTPERPLLVRWVDLPRTVQAAVLQLDPVRDRAEYSIWVGLGSDGIPAADLPGVVERMLSGSPEERALAQRVQNLAITSWPVWAQGRDLPAPPSDARVRVRDLSGFDHPAEALVAAVEVVERLWAERASRRPTLLVIDEAHNLCPAVPESPLQKLLSDRLVQIAAEGRKYGLWLLLSTQRPSKVHPQALSQCDNLVLMRMNSPSDLAELGEFFGFVPESMLRVSPHFSQGELLVGGTFVPVPSLGRVGARLTLEGGSDVRVPMP